VASTSLSLSLALSKDYKIGIKKKRSTCGIYFFTGDGRIAYIISVIKRRERERKKLEPMILPLPIYASIESEGAQEKDSLALSAVAQHSLPKSLLCVLYGPCI